jgi:sugar phosphate isomerase/epimerase
MAKFRRREFVKAAALGIAAGAAIPQARGQQSGLPITRKTTAPRFHLGLASYTFREFTLDRAIEMTKRLPLEKITLKSMHLPLESPEAAIIAAASKVRSAGLDLYGCGVVYMTNEAEVEQAFRYAQTAGMRMIIGVPGQELLGLVDRKIKEFDISLAIHNHGPEDTLYPTPGSAYERIQSLDKRLGLCLDIGHTMRTGIDPSAAVEKFSDRLLDVHIKDVTAATKDGQTVEMGRGIIDIPKFIRTLIKVNYAGTLAFEFEKDGQDPLPGLAESVGYLRGVMAAI